MNWMRSPIGAPISALLIMSAMIGIGWLAGGSTLAKAAALAVGLQWLAAIPAIAFRTERFYDLVGSLTYLTVGLVLYRTGAGGPVASVVMACLAVWALRLGTFLFRRIARAGEDRRFREIKLSPPRFLFAWTIQGMWVFLTALPVWILLTNPPALGFWPGFGLAIWLVGFAIEVISDRQKSAFRADPKNKDAFIRTGLWSLSRHPNYVGEITLWLGMSLVGVGHYAGGEWLALLSPVWVYLLLARGSGVPLLEASADKRWGSDPAYQAYKARTPVLFPWGPRG